MLSLGFSLLTLTLLTPNNLALPSLSVVHNMKDGNNDDRSPWLCSDPATPSLRFPPTIRSSSPPKWQPPPYGWIFGHWYVRYSSRSSYQSLYNFQADTYPLFPTSDAAAAARVNIDLTSYNLPETGNASVDDHVYTAFGYDTPLLDVDPLGFVFQFNGTGALSSISNDWELMGWGYDRNGNAWRVEYETLVKGLPGEEPGINIISRVEDGPDQETVSEIYSALHKMFDGTELAVYVANTTELVVDGRRTNTGPAACDEACMTNANLPSGT